MRSSADRDGETGTGTGAEAVVAVELRRVALPLVVPMVSAHGREDVRDVVLVRVVLADGTVGWGECSALARPTYTSEHTAGAWAVLRDELVPALLAGRPDGVVGHPMARAAVGSAVLDARLRTTGVALAAHLAEGADVARTVATTAVVGRGRATDVVRRVAAELAAGAALVKLKATPDESDLAVVEAVRLEWPELALAVDWNGSADLAGLARLDRLDLAYVEQPAPADDLVASAAFAASIGAPVALDESIGSPADLAAAVALGAGRVVNVKPARVGGVSAAAHLVRAAQAAGLDAFVGGMLETGVGRAAALAVAAQAGCTLPTDLGPSSRYVARDLTDPFELDAEGRLAVPAGAGIGVVPHAEQVEAATTHRWTAPS